ncbi:DsbA family oxidoreductase [Faunimonas sp. B44]|uniref:DsbA family oxidoreductase n=1 Tax=Faunimonas sp. B44 TaxID=3461493 RepID=UPI0040443319
MSGTAIAPLAIDVVSDVMCPWCYIGKRRLEKALALAAPLAVAVRWRPYQLDPTLPPEGKDRGAYLSDKFGDPGRIAAMHERLSETGAAEGIAFDFAAIRVSPNTLDAHRLSRWALTAGVQDAVIEALFRAYFVEGRNVGDQEVLVAIAAEAGMEPEVVARLLAGDADRARIEEEVALARRVGVTGVPTFILADRYAVVGAQAAETIAEALAAVARETAENGDS